MIGRLLRKWNDLSQTREPSGVALGSPSNPPQVRAVTVARSCAAQHAAIECARRKKRGRPDERSTFGKLACSRLAQIFFAARRVLNVDGLPSLAQNHTPPSIPGSFASSTKLSFSSRSCPVIPRVCEARCGTSSSEFSASLCWEGGSALVLHPHLVRPRGHARCALQAHTSGRRPPSLLLLLSAPALAAAPGAALRRAQRAQYGREKLHGEQNRFAHRLSTAMMPLRLTPSPSRTRTCAHPRAHAGTRARARARTRCATPAQVAMLAPQPCATQPSPTSTRLKGGVRVPKPDVQKSF
jgi:hypothetical protein